MKKTTMYAALILALIIMAVVDLYNSKKKPKSDIVKEPGIIVMDSAISKKGIITGSGNLIYNPNDSFIGNASSSGIPCCPTYTICIGKGAGTYLTTEKHCVIVGHSKKHRDTTGSNMIWLVDWNEPYLKKNRRTERLLKQYYNDVILKGLDSEELRTRLSYEVREDYVTLIGANALRDTTK